MLQVPGSQADRAPGPLAEKEPAQLWEKLRMVYVALTSLGSLLIEVRLVGPGAGTDLVKKDAAGRTLRNGKNGGKGKMELPYHLEESQAGSGVNESTK